MECKNCYEQIEDNAHFCDNCGARVIRHKITIKHLLGEFAKNYLGWDNRFLVTLKKMLLSPQEVLHEYVNGVRKRYVNPFAFFTIGAAIAVFIFNVYAENFVETNVEYAKGQAEIMKSYMDKMNIPFSVEEQIEAQKKMSRYLVKYFNLFSFLTLPFYAFIAFLTYKKPYNYAEHLVITCYIQGFLFFVSTIVFLLSLITHPLTYFYSTLLFIVYYLYAYSKLYKHTMAEAILKFLKFIGICAILIIGIPVLAFIIGFLAGKFL